MILAAIGGSSLAVPGLSDLIWPIILVVIGGGAAHPERRAKASRT